MTATVALTFASPTLARDETGVSMPSVHDDAGAATSTDASPT